MKEFDGYHDDWTLYVGKHLDRSRNRPGILRFLHTSKSAFFPPKIIEGKKKKKERKKKKHANSS
jgi:hypothetical protein